MSQDGARVALRNEGEKSDARFYRSHTFFSFENLFNTFKMADNLRTEIPPELKAQLETFRRQLWRTKLTEAVLAGFLGLFVSFLLVFCLDRLMPTPGWLRLFLLLAGTSLFTFFAPYWINRWLLKNRKENQLARLISRKFPRLGDRLLGVLELSSQHESDSSLSPTLRAAATRDVAEAASKRDFGDALPSNRNRSGLIALATLVVIVGGTFLLLPKAGVNAFQRWLFPLSDTARYTLTKFDESLPKKLIVPKGEPFSLNATLAKDSESRPASAKARYGTQDWSESNRRQESYRFDFPGQQEESFILLSAGDARARIPVLPMLPPSLESVQALIDLPEYLQQSPRQIPVNSGTLAALAGSQISLTAGASRDLEQGFLEARDLANLGAGDEPEAPAAETIESLKATTNGARATFPAIAVKETAREVRLSWKDTFGLSGSETFRLRLEPLTDESPSVYMQGAQRQIAILPEETVEFEVIAQDDFGLRKIGLEWSGDSKAASSAKRAQGELDLLVGGPAETSLATPVAFSPIVHEIQPQQLSLRAYTEDYLPERGRVYSQPITLYILTRDEHAQMVKDRFDRIIGELEDATRNEESNLDENKRLERLTEEDLQMPETAERLQKQVEAERENIEKLAEMNEQMQDLFQDALRNGEIDKETMKKLSNTEQKLGELSEQDLPEVEKKLEDSQEQNSTPEKKKEDLKEATEKQQEAVEKMQDTLQKANDAAEDLEAATFVNRLKRAASEHDDIASALKESMDALIGLSTNDVDPVEERLLGELTLQQKRTASDVRWIQEDLGNFYARTEKEIHKTLLDAMIEENTNEGLEKNRERLTKNLSFRGFIFSSQWAGQLRQWAQLLEGEKEDGNGGGEGGEGGGGGSMEDQDFEFMLRVMKLIQAEQDIRSRTRAIEQLRRSGNLLNTDPPLNRLP